ncbi:sirohydrochlorin chelatase [Streptacidiphilus monticola]|uniref:Sirohydrochlorin chelatase n=1 Tax=Streptacidiphilus monticola TaxID=2161674 RepID=A0ABW1G7R2_9ACTN
MSTAPTPSNPLPVRTPNAKGRGRHRRPEVPEIPAGSPALLLAVPVEATPAAQQIADEIVSLIRVEQPGVDVQAAYLPGGAEDSPVVTDVLAAARKAGLPLPVVVPLSPAPVPALEAALAGVEGVTVTDSLGPHPLLAEAVHVRLSEAGLARADRARLFAINTAADGIVLATVGGPVALELAEVTGVLLAARLAVPVVPAALDIPGSVAAAVEHLRATGSGAPALAPYVLGPELAEDHLKAVAEEFDVQVAEPIGAYASLSRLALGLYLGHLGVSLDH